MIRASKGSNFQPPRTKGSHYFVGYVVDVVTLVFVVVKYVSAVVAVAVVSTRTPAFLPKPSEFHGIDQVRVEVK